MSFLLFDYDRSLASIGGEEGAADILGVPPVRMSSGVTHLKDTIQNVVKPEKKEIQHPILGGTGETETRIVPNEKGQEVGLEGLIIDSGSRLAQYEKQKTRERMNEQRKADGKEPLDSLDRSWWGQYGDMMTRFWRMMSKMDLTVIVTSHEKVDKDDVGRRYHAPNIKGSSADRMIEYFDVVLYHRAEGNGEDLTFWWQTRQTETRPAKDRKGLLEPRMEFFKGGKLLKGGYAKIIGDYRKAGIEHPKILAVGESGRGKTLSLQTLGPLVQAKDGTPF